MDLGDELSARARADARDIAPSELTPTALDLMRVEAGRLFEALPEPPSYRRSKDPLRDQAEALVPGAVQLLARLYAATSLLPDQERLENLRGAVELHLRALAAIKAGEISRADQLCDQAWEAARAISSSGSFFKVEGGAIRKKVFDPATGLSRYDPQPEQSLTVQLFCPNDGCKHPGSYAITPRYAAHRFTCLRCTRPFTGHFVELIRVEVRDGARASHYVLHVNEVGGDEDRVLEFDDASRADFGLVARDLVVLLYEAGGALGAVENLSSGRVLWVMPKGPCFLATAVYGQGAPELLVLRTFRDDVLLQRAWGRAFVRAYYAHGFRLAPYFRGGAGRRLLKPVLDGLTRWLSRN